MKASTQTSLLYLALRLANTALTIAWGFLLTAVMLRAVGVEAYTYFIFVAVIGIYIAGSNFGISELVYAHFRQVYLTGEVRSIGHLAMTALSLYGWVALLASALFVPIALFTGYGAEHQGAVLAFFFLTIFNFPWIMVKALSEALDHYLHFETIELIRRGLQILCVLSILVGVSPTIAFCVAVGVWLAAYAFTLPPLLKTLQPPQGHRWQITRSALTTFFDQYGPKIRPSIVFSLSEFAIYNFAYLFVPLAFVGGKVVVLYDTFYKLVRAVVAVNMVASSGLMPLLTKAFHAETRGQTLKILLIVLGLSLGAMTAFIVSLAFAGDLIFNVLLDGKIEVETPFLLAISIMAIANAVQNSAGAFIVRVGEIHRAQNLAVLILAAMLLMSAFIWSTGRSFDEFLISFSILYALGAVAWLVTAYRIISTSGEKNTSLKGYDNETFDS